MSTNCARGEHLLLLPEDAPGLVKPVYVKITRITGALVAVVDVDDAKRKWKISTTTAAVRKVSTASATGPQPGLWLRQAVAVQLGDSWVYGQVVRVTDDQLIVRHGVGVDTTVRIPDAMAVDPIIALLLWDIGAPGDATEANLEERHSIILDRLLGSTTKRSTRPSRDILVLLDGIGVDGAAPSATTQRTWLDPVGGTERSFRLQHAIDYVHVTDSAARRVTKAIRDSVGESFCRPPPSTSDASDGSDAASPRATARPHAKRSPPSEDSFFGTANPSPPVDNADHALHARIVHHLIAHPDLLAHYLERAGDAVPLHYASRRVERHWPNANAMIRTRRAPRSPSTPSTSPVDFVDGLISHPAVQFAPHPGTLMRLFDQQFGTRGLSIMHLAWLNSIQKMDWITQSGVNMQNFSRAVALPVAPTLRSLDEICMALSSYRTYCVAFCTDDVVAIAQALLHFVQQLLGQDTWMVDDLPRLVFWLNGRLELFRTKAVQDLEGGTARLLVHATITAVNPEYQAIVQQITQRTLAALLRASAGAVPTQTAPLRSSQKPSNVRHIKQERREQQQPRHAGALSAFAAIRHVIPRRDNRELCLRFLSMGGCPGAPGDPSQCDQPQRVHDVPAAIHPDLRAEYTPRAGVVQAALAVELTIAQAAAAVRTSQKLAEFGLRGVNNRAEWQSIWSELVRRSKLSLPDLVRIVRGESPADRRPNKALVPVTYARLLHGYAHRQLMMRIAMEGFQVRWLRHQPTQQSRPRNHRSATTCGDRVVSRIVEGENAGTYLIVDAALFDQWAVHVSPFGAVPKGEAHEQAIRLIHDLSHPDHECPNAYTDATSLPPVNYEHVAALARRIDHVRARFPSVAILMLKGDVNGAFRHLRQHADDVGWMCGLLPERHAGVVDLSAL